MDTIQLMASILAGLFTLLLLLQQLLTPAAASAVGSSDDDEGEIGSRWFATGSDDNPGKRAWEAFTLVYSAVWIFVFAVIIGLGLYEEMAEVAYMVVCVGLCLPIFLFPWLYPSRPDSKLPFTKRFATKAILWLAIYSHIGNYWYTHYFYSVLKAKYTFPSWRLNDVPIPLYFATFFYFCTYHTLSNLIIRKAMTSYSDTWARKLFLVVLVATMAYCTAFMETLTISGFPYYSFEDRDMAYTVGSAFYGIYFIVSFPMFYMFEESASAPPKGLWDCCVDSLGGSMLILILLDAVRLWVGEPLKMA